MIQGADQVVGIMWRSLLSGRGTCSREQTNYLFVSGAVQCRVNIVKFSPGTWRIYLVNTASIQLVFTPYYSTNQPNIVDGDAFLKLAIAIASPSYCTGSLRLSICNRGEDFSLE